MGDVSRFEEEEARLSSMHNLLNLAGFSQDVYIDWAEDVFDLLRRLAGSVRLMDGAGPQLLLDIFNDMSASMAIITYFKVSRACRPREPPLTVPAAGERLGAVARRRVQALRPHGRRQDVLHHQHRGRPV